MAAPGPAHAPSTAPATTPAQAPSTPSLSRLSGKVALITGGASPAGFGAAITTRFIAEGAKVLLGDLNASGCSSFASSLNSPDIIALGMDVTREADWTKAVDTIMEKWGRLDVIVNNAGTTYRNKPTQDVTEEEWMRVFDVNVKSVFWSVKIAVPRIVEGKRGGSVINISSTGSERPRPGLVWYNSSKGAVSNATKGLAAELGPHQIRVTAICPLLSATQLFSSFVGVEDTEENRKKFAESIPLQRLTDPMDIGNAAVFLASDEGKFVTGVNFPVDGGRCI